MNTPLKTALLTIALFIAATSANVLAADTTAAPPLTGLLTQLTADSKSAADPQLQSLSCDLGSKIQSLSKLLGDNAGAKNLVQGALQSVLGAKSTDSLNALQKLSEAKLTPEQSKLAKEVRDVASAYLVQKNFGALEGSQSDVAQIVSSLRKGQAATALPSIKKVAANTKLSQPQKDFLKSLADKYAPGVSKAHDALKSLKSFPGLGN